MRSPFLAVVLIAVAPGPVVGQTLEGVWKPVVVAVDSGAISGRHTSDAQPGLMIFTKRHYSMVFVQGFAPRPQLSDTAKDEELGKVFAPFTANAGTYQRSDSTITFTPIVAKVPAVMSGTPFTLRARTKGDTLWVVGGPGAVRRQETTWVRVERR
jgi:hypothetical protein